MPSNLKLSVQSVTPDVTLTLSDPYIGSAYSPQVDVSEIDGGHEVAITYKAPSGITTDTFDVLDGVDGTDGTDGVDGVSPTVEIESTTDAHTITITDADGEHTYEVSTYADEEAARATAESSRVAAESSRVTAEQARVTAESSRTAAESARVTAEASRATAEQSRAAAETARESAESTRVTAETARATAESARATAETTRDTAEQSRATAETARASAESGRVTAEQGRASAENARASAESARVMAESARASAETSRTTAESARATAESTRATEWATIKTEAQDTTRAAEDATDAAQDAAADATAAAAEARAASAATWLSGNVLFGELAESTVLTADDVYAAPPKGVEVFGKSTQDGTPTPDAPVEIKSVDDLTLALTGKNVFGGTALRDAALAGLSQNTTGTDSIGGDYVTVRAWNYDLFSMPFKDNTQYTLILRFSKSDTNASLNMRFLYTDGTYTSIQKQDMAASTLYTIAVTSTANKTIEKIQARNNSGITYAYYEGCGLFEGVLTADQFEPYVGTSVSIPLSNHIARSLPDGTRDTLTLSYVAPSTREGWGVYSKTLVQYTDTVTFDDTENWKGPYNYSSGAGYYTTTKVANNGQSKRCNYAAQGTGGSSGPVTCYFGGAHEFNVVGVGSYAPTLADWIALVATTPVVVDYKLVTPIVHDLGTIELPVLPNPLTAWADGGSAQPTMQLEYERALSIVIPRIEAAISDLATS